MTKQYLLVGAAALALAACGGGNDKSDAAVETVAEESVASIPESLAPFGDGYPNPGAPCRQLGESAATSNYLDDSAMLVGCPTEAAAEAIGGKIVGNVEGVRLVSVPANKTSAPVVAEPAKAAAEAETTSKPVAAKAKTVPIRGANSLESRCQARVARETGARVIGTNRIEESEAAIGIFVNVQGAQAPWRCLAYRDGTVGEVMYTGSEGAM